MSLNKPLLGDQLRSITKTAVDEGVTTETITNLFNLVLKKTHQNCDQNAVRNGGRTTNRDELRMQMKPSMRTTLGVRAIVCVCAVAAVTFGVYMYNPHAECLLPAKGFVTKAMRPIQSCACAGTREIREVTSISREEFGEKHAYTSVPLVVRGGAAGWPAMRTFNYSFFKELYTRNPSTMRMVVDYCMYFHYGTNLVGLEDVFNMTESRVNNEPGQTPWYIGWCDRKSSAKKEIEKHFTWPEFLPDGRHGNQLWVWLGWQGRGAKLHIDTVHKPAWQAQVAGIKTWRVLPPVECMSVCHELNFTLYPGDILTQDGDNWYHATQIHGDDMTVSIGAEY